MRISQLFSKTTRQLAAQEVSTNAKLLLRGGFVYRNLAGVWSLLPLGYKVMQNIETIIRQELEAVGCQELLLNNLQARDVWEASGRWQTLKGDMYQFKDPGGSEIGLGFTHEEVIAGIAKDYIHSANDLPKAVFQIQKKFRYEPRPRSGLLRGREFGMKDLYSFHANEKDLDRFYKMILGVYKKIFEKMSLEALVVEASGGVFSKQFSHEFQVIAEAGEDTIYRCDACDFAQNKELISEDMSHCPACKKGNLTAARSIEVGNTFRLGTTYSKAAGLAIETPSGRQPVVMASYGIGTTRLIGAIVEAHHDETGIIWPQAVAPYRVHLIALGQDQAIIKKANALYEKLNKEGVSVLYDDRVSESVGVKLGDADLIGCPVRVIISHKTGERVELKPRNRKNPEVISVAKLIDISRNF